MTITIPVWVFWILGGAAGFSFFELYDGTSQIAIASSIFTAAASLVTSVFLNAIYSPKVTTPVTLTVRGYNSAGTALIGYLDSGISWTVVRIR